MDHVMTEIKISTRLYVLLSRIVIETLFDNVKFYASFEFLAMGKAFLFHCYFFSTIVF